MYRNLVNRRDFLKDMCVTGVSVGLLSGVVERSAWNPFAMAADPVVKLGEGASLGGKRIFPADNPWNQDISREAVDPSSDKLIASIGLEKPLHPDFGTVYNGVPNGIPYIVVAGTQAKVPVKFQYAAESDPGPYPIPANAPIEGGPNGKGDRHILVLDRDNWKLYELFDAHFENNAWRAGSGAIFDLNASKELAAGWTSADAAGLPILPGLVRYDEVIEQKAITHALRFTCQRTRHAYIAPARHYASPHKDANLPPMGMRMRLKADFDISKYPAEVQVILRALKKYGMFVADNGGDWFLSGAPSPKWNDDALHAMKQVKGKNFEVVKMGEMETRMMLKNHEVAANRLH